MCTVTVSLPKRSCNGHAAVSEAKRLLFTLPGLRSGLKHPLEILESSRYTVIVIVLKAEAMGVVVLWKGFMHVCVK